jgi:Ca2+-binding RTX toxin-like protein
VICGEGGNDVLIPTGGTDLVIGGDGFDYVSLESATAGGTIDLTAATAVAPGVNASLLEVEGAFGSPFDDVLIGNGASNDFFGLGGDDAIDGLGGLDFARFDFATKRIRADLAVGSATGEGVDALTGIEGLVGGAKDDELVGNGKGNVLYGLRGDDLLSGVGKADALFGGPGADALFGGRGNDDLFGGPGRDVCVQAQGSGAEQSC